MWKTCELCGLKYQPRSAGNCPRCAKEGVPVQAPLTDAPGFGVHPPEAATGGMMIAGVLMAASGVLDVVFAVMVARAKLELGGGVLASPPGIIGSAVFDFICAVWLLQGKQKGREFTLFRVGLGLLIFGIGTLVRGDLVGFIALAVFAGAIAMLLVGTPGSGRRWGAAGVGGAMLLLQLVGMGVVAKLGSAALPSRPEPKIATVAGADAVVTASETGIFTRTPTAGWSETEGSPPFRYGDVDLAWSNADRELHFTISRVPRPAGSARGTGLYEVRDAAVAELESSDGPLQLDGPSPSPGPVARTGVLQVRAAHHQHWIEVIDLPETRAVLIASASATPTEEDVAALEQMVKRATPRLNDIFQPPEAPKPVAEAIAPTTVPPAAPPAEPEVTVPADTVAALLTLQDRGATRTAAIVAASLDATGKHVVVHALAADLDERATRIDVYLKAGQKVDGYPAQLVARHPRLGVVLLRFEAPFMPKRIGFVPSEPMRSGQAVVLAAWSPEEGRAVTTRTAALVSWQGRRQLRPVDVDTRYSGGLALNEHGDALGLISLGLDTRATGFITTEELNAFLGQQKTKLTVLGPP